jgi:adenylate kinase
MDKGWVLDGFPRTKADAEAMKTRGCQPNRLFWLDVDKNTCMERLVHRRYDIVDGSVHNLLVEESNQKSSWVQNAADVDFSVQKRMTDALMYKRELESAYGFRTSVTDTKGIMQEIPAFGLGEVDMAVKERVYEYVRGSLLKPVPVVPKIA